MISTSLSQLALFSVPLILGAASRFSYRQSASPNPEDHFQGESLERDASGRTLKLRLTSEQDVDGDRYPKKAILAFDSFGALTDIQLPHKWTFRGYQCAVEGPRFYFRNEKNQKTSRPTSIHIHSNGNLASLKLASSKMIADNLITSGTEVYWSQDGIVRCYHFLSSARFAGLKIPSHTFLSLFPNGAIQEISFSDHMKKIDGFPEYEGREIRFHNNGRIHRACINSARTLSGVSLSKKTWVEFNEDGSLLEATYYSTDTEPSLRGSKLPKDSQVTLNHEGKIVRVKLGDAMEILRIILPMGTTLYYNEHGNISHVHVNQDCLIFGNRIIPAKDWDNLTETEKLKISSNSTGYFTPLSRLSQGTWLLFDNDQFRGIIPPETK